MYSRPRRGLDAINVNDLVALTHSFNSDYFHFAPVKPSLPSGVRFFFSLSNLIFVDSSFSPFAMGEKQPEAAPHIVGANGLDDAVVYLESHAGGTDGPQVDLQALRWKIDCRLMPYMFCCYVLQFLDKVMLNVSHPFFMVMLKHFLVLTWTAYA